MKKTDKQDREGDFDGLTKGIYLFAVIFSVVGLIVLILFLLMLRDQFQLLGSGNVELSATAQVGDFIGGLVGAIWAFSGVLLFFSALQLQRKEFRLQREELINQRTEFELNRLTNIVFRQIELAEKYMRDFKITEEFKMEYREPELVEYDDITSFTILSGLFENLRAQTAELEDDAENKEAKAQIVKRISKIIYDNTDQFLRLYKGLNSNCDVMRSIFIKDNISVEDLNELKSIYFRSLGEEFLSVTDLLHTYLSKVTENNEPNLFDKEQELYKKLESFLNFKKLRYDKSYIEKNLKNRNIYTQFL